MTFPIDVYMITNHMVLTCPSFETWCPYRLVCNRLATAGRSWEKSVFPNSSAIALVASKLLQTSACLQSCERNNTNRNDTYQRGSEPSLVLWRRPFSDLRHTIPGFTVTTSVISKAFAHNWHHPCKLQATEATTKTFLSQRALCNWFHQAYANNLQEPSPTIQGIHTLP